MTIYVLSLVVNIDARPSVIHTALKLAVPANAQASQGDIGRWDTQLFAAAAKAFDDGTGKLNRKGSSRAGGRASNGRARAVRPHEAEGGPDFGQESRNKRFGDAWVGKG